MANRTWWAWFPDSTFHELRIPVIHVGEAEAREYAAIHGGYVKQVDDDGILRGESATPRADALFKRALQAESQEQRAEIERLRGDCLVAAMRLAGEADDTFAPETLEFMVRWRPIVEQHLHGAICEEKNDHTLEKLHCQIRKAEWEASQATARYQNPYVLELERDRAAQRAALEVAKDQLREAKRANERFPTGVDSLYEAIKHGDDEHQAWLKNAIEKHFRGEPVSPPTGTGRKDAEIERLRAQNLKQLLDDTQLQEIAELRAKLSAAENDISKAELAAIHQGALDVQLARTQCAQQLRAAVERAAKIGWVCGAESPLALDYETRLERFELEGIPGIVASVCDEPSHNRALRIAIECELNRASAEICIRNWR